MKIDLKLLFQIIRYLLPHLVEVLRLIREYDQKHDRKTEDTERHPKQ